MGSMVKEMNGFKVGDKVIMTEDSPYDITVPETEGIIKYFYHLNYEIDFEITKHPRNRNIGRTYPISMKYIKLLKKDFSHIKNLLK